MIALASGLWFPLRRRTTLQNIKVDEVLWASSMLPEGIAERWFIASGVTIKVGERIAEVRIEDALHEIVEAANTVIEPGSSLAPLDTPRPRQQH